ncbi:hypothetical protein ACPOL_1968 [Acidisarcina polymorpha]|uniref:Uncharacterized protein n=1 Tax=Acidisarcina polymorpha TaxID=2211140 RepID=A0A2Z5FXR6_9BACT|nr:hypothetical protein ACPOL_1968 [Acidisarcina polymorpha]
MVKATGKLLGATGYWMNHARRFLLPGIHPLRKCFGAISE